MYRAGIHTNFITACVDVLRSCLVAFFILCVGLRACVVGGTELDIGLGKVLSNATGQLVWYSPPGMHSNSRIDHAVQCLTTSGIVKEYLVLLQRGEAFARL